MSKRVGVRHPIHMRMWSPYRFIFIQIKVIFIYMKAFERPLVLKQRHNQKCSHVTITYVWDYNLMQNRRGKSLMLRQRLQQGWMLTKLTVLIWSLAGDRQKVTKPSSLCLREMAFSLFLNIHWTTMFTQWVDTQFRIDNTTYLLNKECGHFTRSVISDYKYTWQSYFFSCTCLKRNHN